MESGVTLLNKEGRRGQGRRVCGSPCRGIEMIDEQLTEELRARVKAFCAAVPGVETQPAIHGHNKYSVGTKPFAYYLVDHHGDGRVAVTCKAAPGLQDALIHADPSRFFVPAYSGANGWIGIDLDGPIDWQQVEDLLRDAYLLQAPKRLAAELRQRMSDEEQTMTTSDFVGWDPRIATDWSAV